MRRARTRQQAAVLRSDTLSPESVRLVEGLMGHQHLLKLPRSRDWRAVIAMIAEGAAATEIAAATSKAAELSMIEAADDDTVRQSFYFLAQIPIAARESDFASRLRNIGIFVGDQPNLVEVGSAMMDAIDLHTARSGSRSDYGEIAQLAAVESLQTIAGRELPDLFGADGVRVSLALRQLAEPEQFAVLARDFFARLTRRHLNYYLSRELAAHIGPGRRFASLLAHEEFEQALDLHCREASRIIKEFAGDWFAKHVYHGSGITPDLAGRFVAVAARKIRKELGQRQLAHA